MQTIEEYKEYTKQLEGEVGKWHNAYDALVIERNALVIKLLQYEKTVEVSAEDGSKCVALSRKTVMEYEQICKAVEDFRDRVRHQEEPFFDKLPEEVKTEIQRAHLEMVLNRDFKPIYVNVAPRATVHEVKIEMEVK